MRQAARDHRVGEPPPRRHPQALIVEECALAALGDEQFLVHRIVDHPGDDRSFAFERDRDRELRDAVQEIRGAVERIDDPDMGRIGARLQPAFLTEKSVARTRPRQLRVENLLGATIGGGNEIRRTLQRYLQVFDLAEIAPQARARPCARRRP